MTKKELKRLAREAVAELRAANFVFAQCEEYTCYVRDYHEDCDVNYMISSVAEHELETYESIEDVEVNHKFRLIIFETATSEQQEKEFDTIEELQKAIDDIAALNFTTEELREHYRALIDDDCDNMSREDLIKALKDTEFEEHAYNRF